MFTCTPQLPNPSLPAEGPALLEDLAFRLAREASALSAQLPPQVALPVGELLRSMNCYYSNLIEGHNTHPRDIDRARAHIEVQRLVDLGGVAPAPAASRDFIAWAHREFCGRLPGSLLTVTNPDTGEPLPVVPGELRSRPVVVGRHIPPPAAHQRLLWIHPFLDGNGRVARLMSHAIRVRFPQGATAPGHTSGGGRAVVPAALPRGCLVPFRTNCSSEPACGPQAARDVQLRVSQSEDL